MGGPVAQDGKEVRRLHKLCQGVQGLGSLASAGDLEARSETLRELRLAYRLHQGGEAAVAALRKRPVPPEGERLFYAKFAEGASDPSGKEV